MSFNPHFSRPVIGGRRDYVHGADLLELVRLLLVA